MRLRFPAACPRRRSPGAPSSQARRRHVAVESLEVRELLTVDFTSVMGFGAPTLTAGAVAVDAAGDTFIAGTFGGNLNLNPGPGVTTLTSAGNRDIYLAEYSKAGALVWAKDLPSSAGAVAQVNGLALDAAGNLAVTGTFAGSPNLNPGGLGGTLTAAAGRTDAFAAKFTPTGGFLWADKFEGTGTDQGNAVATDAAGDTLVTGSYTGATTFGATTLAGTLSAGFLAKVDPSGNVLWADGFAGAGLDSGAHVATDAAGDAYVGGSYQSSITLGATTLSLPSGAYSAFVAKVTPAGAVTWATGFGGTANTTSGGLVLDASGNVLVDGDFKSAATIGGIALAPTGGAYNGYAAKLDPTGKGLWAVAFSGTDNILPNSLATDGAGAVYLGGQFYGTANFNPGTSAPISLTTGGGSDAFVSKLDASGNFVYARQGGGTANDGVGALAVVAPDVIEVVGKYSGPAAFGPTVLQSVDSTNMFLARISTYTPPPPPVGGPINFTTAIGVGSPTLDARAVVQDALGNSYVTGFFRGPANFNPSGTAVVLNSVGNHDIYLAEYSPTGSLVWAKDLPNSAGSGGQANALAMDAAGNLALTGYFTGATNFNPGGAGGTLTNATYHTDAFAAKFTPTGGFLWADKFEGAGNIQGLGIATDAAGDTVATGSYTGATAFGATTLTGTVSAAFVTKIDPSGNVLWADGFAGTGLDTGTAVAIDASGNIYAGGTDQGTITFNATTTLTGAGGSDVYIARLAPTGVVTWAVGFGGAATDTLGGLAVDAAGEVYGVGTFGGTAKFGTFTMTPNGGSGSDAFIAKLDPTGAVTWADQVGGGLSDFGTAVALDAQANVYVGGEFSGQANLDPHGTANFSSSGGLDAFVEKLDTNGLYQWALAGGGPSSDYLTGLAVHAPNDLSAIGRYTGPANFGPNLLQSIDSTNLFVARISVPVVVVAPGPADFQSAVSVGGNIIDARGVALDAAGNSYVTGTFSGAVNFATGTATPVTLTSGGYEDIYVASYTQAGTLIWAKDVSGTGILKSQGNGIAVDAAGDVYVTGTYAGAITFAPGVGGTLTSLGGSDAFVAKFSSTGQFDWAASLGGTGNDLGTGIAADATGNVYASGSFAVTGHFGANTLVSAGGSDTYVTMLDPNGNDLWATRFGGTASDSGGRVAVDATGNVYASGGFTGAAVPYVKAGGVASTLVGNATLPSVFTLKLNQAGGIVWADSFTGVANTSAGGLAVDKSGNVFVSGTDRNTTAFGALSLTPNGMPNSNAFVAKVNPDGSVAWAEEVGGTSAALGTDVEVDALGNVYLGGEFTGTTNFNPGTGAAANLNGFGALDIFVDMLDANGNFLLARQAGGTGNDYLRDMAVNAASDLTLVGQYTPAASFNIITLNDQVDNGAVYVARIAPKLS